MVDLSQLPTCGQLQASAAEMQRKVAAELLAKELVTVSQVLEAVKQLKYEAIVVVAREDDNDDRIYALGDDVPLNIHYRWAQQLSGGADSVGTYRMDVETIERDTFLRTAK